MIAISLLSFVRSGVFGPVSLGQSREHIGTHMGLPDDWSPPARSCERAKIWKYGTIEFHLPQGTLELIHADSFDVPEGGARIDLDPWVVRRGLALPAMERALRTENVSCERKADACNPGAIFLRTEKGITFLFAEFESADPPGLSAFSLKSSG